MLKAKTKLIIAGVVLAVLAGAYFGGTVYRSAKIKKAEEAYKTIKVTDLGADKVVKIEIPTSGIVLEKKGENWEAPTVKIPVKLDQEEIKGAAWSLANMSADRILEENPKDLSVYGLDNPKSRVILTLVDGSTIELLGGNMAPTKSSYYAMKKGENKVYALPLYPGERLYLKMDNLRDKKLATFEPKDVMHVRIVSGGTKIEIEPKENDDSTVSSFATHVMTSPYKTKHGVDPEAFGGLVQALNVKVKSFVDSSPASLAPYGLNKPSFDLFVQALNSSLHLLIGKETGGVNEVYAKLDSSPEVFIIDDIRPAIGIKPFALVDKFPLIVGIDKVDSFVVKGRGRTLTGEIKREKTKVTSKDKDGKDVTKDETKEAYFLDGKEVEEKSFKDFFQSCIGRLADSERPAGPLKTRTPEVAIEYRLNSPAGKSLSLRLVPDVRDFYASLLDGTADFLISKAQVDRIFETADKVAPKK